MLPSRCLLRRQDVAVLLWQVLGRGRDLHRGQGPAAGINLSHGSVRLVSLMLVFTFEPEGYRQTCLARYDLILHPRLREEALIGE